MGRGQSDCWPHVTKVEDSKKWICKYCNEKFSGGASRIEAHLGLEGKTGNIRRCSRYPENQGVYNNLASTSSNPPQAVINTIFSTHDQGGLEVIDTQNNLEITNLSEGVNGSGRNRSVCESEIKQLDLDLEFEKNDIEKQLECLESRGKKRKPEVDVWLEGLLEIKETVRHMNNLDGTHDISKLIKKMKRHKEEKPLTLSTEYVGWQLDIKIKKVLKLLDDKKVFVIGICGMGGVGKSLLATLVKKELMRKTTFKDVCWVTVSQNASISKLQHDIAKRIGVKLDEDDDERVRADNLSLALEKKEKLVLILDDVWKYIDLEKVGLYPKVNGIKVILTTRLEHVCHQMDCLPDHMIQMMPLMTSFDEDWDLFRVKLGHNGTPIKLSPEIEKIAKDIVHSCYGLPLGISVIARTMKGIDDIHQWKHALNKLEKVEMGPEVEEEVLKVLERSYDNLMDKELQNCFLYCALLSDYFEYEYANKDGDKDELIMKLVESGQINKDMCLEEIFDEGNTILNKLDAHSLISSKHDNILVHPLLRSMACYIMKESQRNVMVNDRSIVMPLSHEWATDLELVNIRCCDIEENSEDLSPNCPKLSTLIINEVSISHVPESFFKYMNSLTILDLSYNTSLVSLPKSITNLTSLVSLMLNRCDSLKHVPPLGELQALSRLVISDTSIEEPPQGLEKLINLKWLDLSYNPSLHLELGSFSSYLTKLQYLDLRDTPAVVMVEDIERMKMLECFGGAIDCEDYYQFMQKNLDVCFGLIKTYHLILGTECVEEGRWYEFDDDAEFNLKRFVPGDYENRYIEIASCSHSFSHILSKDHTYMKINGNDDWGCLCKNLSYGTSSSLKKLEIHCCRQLDSLFCLSDSCSFCTNIHKLEVLHLLDLQSLTVICEDVFDVRQSLSPGGIFSCLKEIDIKYCNLIEKLFTSQVVQQLQNLETISVWKCNSMKEIFAVNNNDDDDSSIITLPNLTRLNLWYLPELKTVCKGSIRCGSSPAVRIGSCPSLVQRCPTIERVEITDSLFYILEFV